MFGFCLFGGCSKFSGSGDFGDFLFQRGSSVKETGSILNDLMEDLVGVSAVKELGFFLPSVVLKELRVGDGIDIDVLGGLGGGLIKGIVMGRVGSVGEVKVFQVVKGLVNRQGHLSAINSQGSFYLNCSTLCTRENSH